MKYITFCDTIKDDVLTDSAPYEFSEKEKAISRADDIWMHLTDREKETRRVYVLLDGEIIYRPDVFVGGLYRATHVSSRMYQANIIFCVDYTTEDNQTSSTSVTVYVDSYFDGMTMAENIDSEVGCIADELEKVGVYADEDIKSKINIDLGIFFLGRDDR